MTARLLIVLLGAVEDPATLFVQANAAYEAGNYGEALEAYEALVAEGHESGHLLYNLGNCYLRTGQLGDGVAAYRKANALMPRDEDVRANLEFARKSTKDAVAPEPSAAIWRTLFFWHFWLSRVELGWAFVSLNVILWCLLALRLYRRESELLRWAVIAAVTVVVAVGSSLAIRWARPERVAVIQLQEVSVHSGTNEDTVVRFKLHEGTEVAVIDVDSGWLRIALPDSKQGWIPESAAALLFL